jgi:hypothetical protein
MDNIKQGDFFTGDETGIWNDQSPPSSVEVMNRWSYAATTPYVYIALLLC